MDILVNFSVVGTHSGVSSEPRLTMLIADRDGNWDGDVDTLDQRDCRYSAGRFDMVAGANSMRLVDGRYVIEAELKQRPISLSLELKPMSKPVVANRVTLADNEFIRWMVVPRLLASGKVRIGENRHEIRPSPAYHDRNWGQFSWGGSYAWEWATILPEEPGQDRCLVYSRISDRLRGTTLSKSLILWKGPVPSRKFFGHDVSVSIAGLMHCDKVLQIPRITALVKGRASSDVPQQMHIAAVGFGSEIEIEMMFEDFAQIGVPNDRDLGLTGLSELRGHARVKGYDADGRFSFSARVQAEINSAEP